MGAFSDVSAAKLLASGLTKDYALEHGVRPVSSPEDLPEEFGSVSGLCPVPGMLFPWRDPRDPDAVVWQYRPDHPVEPAYKYVFGEGQHQPLGLIQTRATAHGSRIAIVEGTLQSLAFARYAPADVTVYAIPGCDGWSKNKNATEALSVVEGCDVVVFLDADAGTNASVYDAGHELARFSKIYGATEVYFCRSPGRGVNGLDDFLGSAAEDKREGLLARMMDNPERKPATRKPPGKPKAKSAYGLATAEGLPDPNDTLLGTVWADTHRDRFRWLTDQDSWLGYRDGRWSRVGPTVPGSSVLSYLSRVSEKFFAAARGKDGEAREKLEDTGRMLLAGAKRQSVLNTAANYGAVHLTFDETDQHPMKFCVANGVLDLDTLEVTPHDPDLLLTTGSDVEYIPGAKCPRFDQFFAEVLPDPDVRAFLLRVFFLAMIGEVREHVLISLIGEGRNGKGTLLRVMSELFSSHATVINAKSLLKQRFDSHEEEIASLAGKRLVMTEETGQGSQWNVARINSWTGGDRLTGRFLNKDRFSFKPSHTLVLATNHRPSVGQGERAFWARYKEVPFEVSVEGREDLTLEPHIFDNELPGVLNRLIEAGRDYLASGLREPMAVSLATAEAKVDADHLARYCADHVAVTNDHENDRIPNPDLYESVIKWWSQNVRDEQPPSDRMFPKMMRIALGFSANAANPRKLGQGKDVRRTWTGIRWLSGGFSDADLKPLPMLGSGSRIIGSMAPDAPPWNVDQENDNETVTGTAAANEDQTTDNSADDVDHGNGITSGHSLPTADTADTTDKCTSSSGNGVKQEDGGYNTPDVCVSTDSPVSIADDRQCAAVGSMILESGAAGVFPGQTGGLDKGDRIASSGLPANPPENDLLGTPLVLDLETRSANDLHTWPEPVEYVRLVGASTPESEPRWWAGPGQVTELVKSSPRVIGHNLVHFDLPALSRIDPEIDVLTMTRERRVFDTMIADSVLFPIMNESRSGEVGRAMKHYGLNAAAERHGVPGKEFDLKRYVRKHYGGDFNAIPWETNEELQGYLLGDVTATREVYAKLDAAHRHPALPEATREYLWREHRVHAIAATMSSVGFAVDEPLLRERFDAGVARKAELTAALVDRYGIPTVKADGKISKSPAATKEGKVALEEAFRSLGVDPDRDITKTASGAISFGGDAMRELADRFSDHPRGTEISELCEVVADSAGIRTVYGTALDHLHSDGRVHPAVATFQASGRWSVTKPGLTVFGKRGQRVTERAVFRATEGNVLMAIDLSQVDTRAVAGHCQDPAYMQLFEPGRDSHRDVAEMVWGSRDDEHRQLAKAISHGWNYGMGIAKIVTQANVTEDVARQFDQAMRERFPRLVEWRDDVRERAAKGLYLDNGFGRLMKPNPDRAWNQGPALYGQGTARDIMMECLLRIDDRAPSVIRMLRAQVHDEAIFEIPESLAGDIKPFIEECFNWEWYATPGSRPVPIIAEGGQFGRSWTECYPSK